MSLAIIYAKRDNIAEVGVAHFFEGRYWWSDRRYPIDDQGNAGPFQKTLDRLIRHGIKLEVTGLKCVEYKPKYYDGELYHVCVVEEET